MQFVVEFRTGKSPQPTSYPHVKLLQDNWDDYGYKTTFYATLHLSEEETVDLGNVKILEEKQTSGYTPMPKEPFERLGSNFCSLGGHLDYYENLFKLGRNTYQAYLRSLSDAAYNDETRARFEGSRGIQGLPASVQWRGAHDRGREQAIQP
jgi:hypothetical protein